MIGRHTRFRENGDLPPWRGPAAKKKPPFSNVRALITRKIVLMLQSTFNPSLIPSLRPLFLTKNTSTTPDIVMIMMTNEVITAAFPRGLKGGPNPLFSC